MINWIQAETAAHSVTGFLPLLLALRMYTNIECIYYRLCLVDVTRVCMCLCIYISIVDVYVSEREREDKNQYTHKTTIKFYQPSMVRFLFICRQLSVLLFFPCAFLYMHISSQFSQFWFGFQHPNRYTHTPSLCLSPPSWFVVVGAIYIARMATVVAAVEISTDFLYVFHSKRRFFPSSSSSNMFPFLLLFLSFEFGKPTCCYCCHDYRLCLRIPRLFLFMSNDIQFVVVAADKIQFRRDMMWYCWMWRSVYCRTFVNSCFVCVYCADSNTCAWIKTVWMYVCMTMNLKLYCRYTYIFFSYSFVWNEWFVHRTCMPFGFRQKGLLFVVVGAAAAAVIFILVYLFVSLMLDCTVFISILIKRYDSTLDKISFSLFVSLSVSFSHPICVYRTYAAFKASFFCSVLLLCSCVPCH